MSHEKGLHVHTDNSDHWLSTDSIAVNSFMANNSPSPTYVNLDRIVDMLMKMNHSNHSPAAATSGRLDSMMEELSELTAATLKIYKDPAFKRVIKAFGWSGGRYVNDDDNPLDCAEFLQALSNLYLKGQQNIHKGFYSENFSDFDAINYLEKIAAFCPDIVIECLQNKSGVCSGSELNASSYNVLGACMLIDISNFSKYSASMCSQGMRGLDELRKATSGVLGKFVKAVYEHDGDVIAFAGDALICVFPVRPDTSGGDKPRDKLPLVDACFRALHCANQLRTVQFQELSTHIGVSYGEMCLSFLGGHNGQWTYLLNGKCLSQLSACIEDAKPHTVVVTKRCRDHLLRALDSHGNINGVPTASSIDPVQAPAANPCSPLTAVPSFRDVEFEYLETGNYLLTHMGKCKAMLDLLNDAGRMDSLSTMKSKEASKKSVFLEGTPNGSPFERASSIISPTRGLSVHFSPTVPSVDLHRVKTLRKGSRSNSIRNISLEDIYAVVNQTPRGSWEVDKDSASNPERMLIDALVLFLPLPVTLSLHSEGNHQISELRQVTTLFMSLDSYDSSTHADPITLQPMFVTAQQVLSDTGAFLRQFLIDDKGCVLIAMWGVPSYTYSNNCSRALYTASAIKARLLELDHRCSMGITTGNVFCGTIGAAERCDYAGIGTEVNLAARLMAKAKERILIDQSTFNNLNLANKELLVPVEAMTLKGMPAPVSPYELPPSATPVLATVDDSSNSTAKRNKLLRKKVMQVLERELDKVGCRGGLDNMSPQQFRQTLIRAPRTKSNRTRGLITNNVHCIIVCGPPGSGKNTAAEYFRMSARARGIQTIHIKLQSIHRNAPYQFIRELFLELVGAENFTSPEQQAEVLDGLMDEIFDNDVSEDALRAARNSIETVLGLYRSASPDPKPSAFYYGGGSPGKTDMANTHLPFSRLSPLNSADRWKQINAPLGAQAPLTLSKQSSNFLLSSYGDFAESASMINPDVGCARDRTDFSFYKVLTALLRRSPTALIVEDAHCCDELSWNELLLMIVGGDVDLSILLLMKTNPNHRLKCASSSHIDLGAYPSMPSTSPLSVSKSTNRAASVSASNLGNMYGSLNDQSMSFLDDLVTDRLAAVGLDHINFASFETIAKHPNTQIIEMKGLNEEEVRNLLLHTLHTDGVSANLVQLVLNVSSGNPYWCKVIAKFVEERGLQHLEQALETDKPQSSSHSLKALVLCRYEQLPTMHQKVLKYASVLGSEFAVEILAAITPVNAAIHVMKNKQLVSQVPITNVREVLELLEKGGFVCCISEEPQLIYAFQNDLIQRTIYDLMVPSDSAPIHAMCAEAVETRFASSLRPFYPLLGYHFKQGGDRTKAFKYELKSAALAISSGAFSDGLAFANSAMSLADNAYDMEVLVELACHASQYLQFLESPGARNELSSSFYQFAIGSLASGTGGFFSPQAQGQGQGLPVRSSSSGTGGMFATTPMTPLQAQLAKRSELSMLMTQSFLRKEIECEHVTVQQFRSLRERAEALGKQMASGQAELSQPERTSLLAAKAELLRSNTLLALPSQNERLRRSITSDTVGSEEVGRGRGCCVVA